VIGVAGVRLTRTAEVLARVTGLGELLTGALLIGFVTSLSGLVTSVTAAMDGHASLAVSNALGGIAAQTMFLAVADMLYPHANLEHAAASESNLLQGALLMVLLAMPLLALGLPGLSIGPVHPVSLLLVATYLFGLRLVAGARQRPMWLPRRTSATRLEDRAAAAEAPPELRALWLSFAVLALAVAGAGWAIARSAVVLSAAAGIGESVVGGVLTAVTTSLPELVVAVAAVRRGALALALGDILGGNAFDVLFLAASDFVYPGGSVYGFLNSGDIFWLALSLLMVGTLLLGLLRRERHGVANIGFESSIVLLLYFGGVIALAVSGGGKP
jgi:cation:H+ antiporter